VEQSQTASVGWYWRYGQAIALLSIVASAFTLTRRIRVDSDVFANNVSILNAILMATPFYLFLLLMVLEHFPRITAVLNRIAQPKVVFGLGLPVIILSWIPYALNLPYIVGSWASLSMLISGIVLGYSFVQPKTANIHALMLAIGLMGIWTGVWEIPYQTLLRVKYDIPQIGLNESMVRICWEWAIEILTAGYGLALVLKLNKMYHVVSVGWWFWAGMTLCIGAILYWVFTGYWVDDHYDWTIREWIQTPGFDKVALFTAKVSKVFFMLALLSLVWRGKRCTK
jgi:hypothetical protein